ncbi:MAG: hypothetical protein FI717_05875 [SAR202 cluster bacterium]|nr:hypothetical protein [Chloroflexota bacterium]MBS34162.1 hypothetical protein [Verrucomicrobiales bacterium]MQF95049.1 hypothetical protein [SAR202 cluster bacterium]HAA95067.1 hypothetical protein [Dehalococcoidia bacterium]MQG33814.1 hypothetical protein [SAR202 cluster bacterium]|tara:strand:- start:6029 stop:6292 length:264 start_codon:yes stop_codon:yes gene_type:complete
MEDQVFVNQIKEKIERMSGRPVELHIDEGEADQIEVELQGDVPVVILGNNVLEYSGLARMGIEYAVACIREERAIEQVEFQVLLARN